jgi:peptidoglycan/xylan/chitin deacetylase (PgdA/CDA1 family)
MAGFFSRGLYYNQIKVRIKEMISNGNTDGAKTLCLRTLQELVGIVILTYHEVDYSENQYVTKPDVFEKQMLFVKQQGYPVITYNDLTNGYDFKKTSVIITFDDARTGLKNYADPILREYNFQYTIFVAPGYINNPDSVDPQQSFSNFLSWNDSGILYQQGGVTLGAHSNTHRSMIEITSDEELESEIHGSKMEIEDRMGVKVNDFAYPYGRFNPEIEEMVIREGYKTVSTILPGINTSITSPFRLRRSVILSMFSEKEFEKIINPEQLRNEFLNIMEELRDKK